MEKPQALPLPRRPATNQRHALPPKRRGEIAELAFMQKAVSLGFGEGGAPSRNPELVEGSLPLHRLREPSRIRCPYLRLRKGKMVALTADDIDCIIAYIVPLNLWYVLPVESFSPC